LLEGLDYFRSGASIPRVCEIIAAFCDPFSPRPGRFRVQFVQLQRRDIIDALGATNARRQSGMRSQGPSVSVPPNRCRAMPLQRTANRSAEPTRNGRRFPLGSPTTLPGALDKAAVRGRWLQPHLEAQGCNTGIPDEQAATELV
jgi:hypothetical protein